MLYIVAFFISCLPRLSTYFWWASRSARTDLPKGVQENTSVEAIQADWDEEIEKVGGLLEDTTPDISCYVPEKSEQHRVEFVIPCEKGDFKVFLNYSIDGNLYNYVIWKNEAQWESEEK